MLRIGIDVGGTFTDVILLDDDDGTLWNVKVPTTPADPVRGVLDGIGKVLESAGAAPEQVGFLGHGTTIATNMLVEGKGAATALVTTRGFRDVLEIRRASRHDRADLYDLFFANPPDLVPRHLRREAQERIRHDGTVETALDLDGTVSLGADLAQAGVQAVAVCFINAHANASHEIQMVEALRRQLPNVFVTASHDINPEMFEYERTSSTVVNAMLGPRCGSYIRTFGERLVEAQVAASPLFMQSNGGLATGAATSERPITLLQSGPAGGVTAAAKLSERLGLRNAITGDMGGTTFDVSLIRDFLPEVRTSGIVQSHAVRVPTIDIESIGAGGGSIAWIDAGGGVHIGPESSGAVPGPACYGRGGDRPTVTDCNLVLGFADPAGFLGGTFALDTDAAHRVIERDLARPLGKSVVEAAWIVRRIANALMAQAIRLMTVERGFDPREFAYICYGGGGPLHAVDLAAELEISRIVVPRLPGLFSAFGMLVADQAYDAQMPVLKNLDQLDRSALRSLAAQIEGKLHGQLARAQVTGAAAAVALRAECRYAGQAETLTVELDPAGGIDDLVEGFEKVHYRHWHFLQQDRPITLVNLRAQAVVPTGYRPRPPEAASGITAPRSSRDRRIFDGTAFRSVPTYQRESLEPGDTIAGPGCIEEGSSCLVFTGREKVVVDGDRNLVVTPQ